MNDTLHAVIPKDTIAHNDHDEIDFVQYSAHDGIFLTQVDCVYGKPFDAIIHMSLKQAERVRDLLTKAIERSR